MCFLRTRRSYSFNNVHVIRGAFPYIISRINSPLICNIDIGLTILVSSEWSETPKC